MTLNEMTKLAEDQARRVLIGTKEELAPSWLLVTGKGDIEIYATPWANTQEKHWVTLTMRLIMRQKQCTAYSLLVEAWMAHVSAEEAGKEYTGPLPSERPDRTEGVVITAANRAGESRHVTFEIMRGKKGVCTELKRLDGPEDRITSAIFDNLLDDKRRAN